MEKLNFLPLWEIERIAKRKRTNLYVFLLFLLFCNLLLVLFFIFNMSNIQKLKMENTYKIELESKDFSNKSIQNEKKIDSLMSYQWYTKEIDSEIILKEMIIKNKEIILHAKVKDYNDYINIVSYIEHKCKVKDVSIAKFDENYLEFTLILEANYE